MLKGKSWEENINAVCSTCGNNIRTSLPYDYLYGKREGATYHLCSGCERYIKETGLQMHARVCISQIEAWQKAQCVHPVDNELVVRVLKAQSQRIEVLEGLLQASNETGTKQHKTTQ